MSAVPHESIAQQLAEMTLDLGRTSGAEPAAVLKELAATAVETVADATYAGITEAHRDGTVRNMAGTHPFATLLDEIQHRHRQGPCLAAAWENHTVRVDDVAVDTRWPDYCHDVLAQTDVRSVLSFQLFTGPELFGALNFYAAAPRAFTPQSVEIGLMYATHTAIVWQMLLRDQQFRSALASRDVIGQAKGILMERFDVDATQAFDLLRRLSQETNTPLVEVAERLVDIEHPPR